MSHVESAGEEISGHEDLSPPVREGLPPSYRMRADAHYVDLLTSRPVSGREPALPSREIVESPPGVPGIEDDLEKSLASLAACTDLLSGAASALSLDVAQTLLRAEIWRAANLVKAAQVLKQHTPPLRTTVRLSAVLDSVLAGFAPERKLRSFELQLAHALPGDTLVVTDERLMVVAISSAVRSMLDIAAAGGSVRISLALAPDNWLKCTVSQNAVAVSDAALSRAFSPEWTDRPGGRAALVTMLAVRQAAALLGGAVEIQPVDRGVGLVLTIPAGF